MLTDNDIQRLIAALEKVFATKAELADFTDTLREDFSTLQTAVDGFTKQVNTYHQEVIVLHHRVTKLEQLT